MGFMKRALWIANPQSSFGTRLSSIRRDGGWSQEALALETGMARSYLSGVERGKRNISLVNICRLAHTLGVKPSQLLELD